MHQSQSPMNGRLKALLRTGSLCLPVTGALLSAGCIFAPTTEDKDNPPLYQAAETPEKLL